MIDCVIYLTNSIFIITILKKLFFPDDITSEFIDDESIEDIIFMILDEL